MGLFRKKKVEEKKEEEIPIRILKILGGEFLGGYTLVRERSIEDNEKLLNDLKKLLPTIIHEYIYEPIGIIYEVRKRVEK